MPFKKIGRNKYVSPSGRKWNKKQIALYYATDGFTKKSKKKGGGKKKKIHAFE